MPVSAGTSLWTDELFEQLKMLIARGLSSGEIAKELRLTRGAVMGKIHRHGLKLKRPASVQKFPRPIRNGGAVLAAIMARQRQERAITATISDNRIKAAILARATALGELPACEPIDLPEEPTTDVQPLSLLELKDGHCRYPIDGRDGSVTSLRFCGCERAHEQTPYCRRHHNICHTPPTNRAERKKVLWQF